MKETEFLCTTRWIVKTAPRSRENLHRHAAKRSSSKACRRKTFRIDQRHLPCVFSVKTERFSWQKKMRAKPLEEWQQEWQKSLLQGYVLQTQIHVANHVQRKNMTGSSSCTATKHTFCHHILLADLQRHCRQSFQIITLKHRKAIQ